MFFLLKFIEHNFPMFKKAYTLFFVTLYTRPSSLYVSQIAYKLI